MAPDGHRAQLVLEQLRAPAEEMRFLLGRGYRRAHALRVVGEHHQLLERERNILERVVFSDHEAARRRQRLVRPEAAWGQRVVIDGYNVLIGIDCLLNGELLFRADDGLIRDIATHRGLRSLARARHAVAALVRILVDLAPTWVELVLDQQVSRSGELAAVCRDALGSRHIPGAARTALCADRAIIDAACGALVSSSDRVIVDATTATLDLVAALAGPDAPVGAYPR